MEGNIQGVITQHKLKIVKAEILHLAELYYNNSNNNNNNNNDSHKLYWNHTLLMDRTITFSRPDMTLIGRRNEEAEFSDIRVP